MYLFEFDDRRRRVAQPATMPAAAPPSRGATRDEVRSFFAGNRR